MFPARVASMVAAAAITPAIAPSGDGWLYGENTTYQPLAGTSGVIAGTVLSAHTGSYTITTAGTLVSGQSVNGGFDVKAKNVTVSNNLIRKGAASTGEAGVDMRWTACVNATVEDNEFNFDTPGTSLNCIMGHDYTAQRNNTHSGTDAFRSSTNNHDGGNIGTNANVFILGNYIHGFAGWLKDPAQGNTPSHNDPWQHEGGNNAVFIGNNVDARVDPTIADGAKWNGGNHNIAGSLVVGQCIQLNHNTQATTSGLVISQNWFDYGYLGINSSLKATDHIDSITSNLFGHHTASNVQINITSGTTVGLKTGNAFVDHVGSINTNGF